MAIEFVNEEHQQLFAEVVGQLHFPFGLPADWTACIYLLTADKWTWRRLAQHVDLAGHSIYWGKIRKLPFGHGEEIMLQLAQQLYNGSGKFELNGLWETLDDFNFNLALRAIRLRRHGAKVLELVG